MIIANIFELFFLTALLRTQLDRTKNFPKNNYQATYAIKNQPGMTNNSTAPTFDGIGHGDPEGDEDHVERVDHGAHVLEEGAHGLRAPPVRPAAADERRREELSDGEALVGVWF